jgi:hypothetical protein
MAILISFLCGLMFAFLLIYLVAHDVERPDRDRAARKAFYDQLYNRKEL